MESTETSTRWLRLPSRDAVVVAVVSLPTLVLSSLDGCTRGPSVTSLVLTHICRFV